MNHESLCDMLKSKPLSELSSQEMESARELAYSILRADYYRDVRSVASSVKDAIESGEIKDWDGLGNYLWESVDGTARVIYTNQAMECVLLSNNSDAMIEEFGPEGIVSDESVNYSAMAFHVMRRDVMDRLRAEGIDHDYWDNLESEEEEDSEEEKETDDTDAS